MNQQPNGSDMPDVPASPVVGLPDPNPGVIPVTNPLAPGHAEDETLGTGPVIGPLRLALPSSVAPSGMLPPPRDVVEEDVTAPDPGTDDKPDDTGKPVPGDTQPLDVAGLAELDVVPPPSNTLLGLAGLGLVGAVADMVWHVVVLSTGPSGAGLNPPVKSSVAPKGIPAAPTGGIGSRVPSGDVVPAPGIGGAPKPLICAALGPDPSSAIMAAIANTRPIKASIRRDSYSPPRDIRR